MAAVTPGGSAESITGSETPAIRVLEPVEPGGPWGYRCDLCPSTWRNFADAEAAAWYALLHGRTAHRAK